MLLSPVSAAATRFPPAEPVLLSPAGPARAAPTPGAVTGGVVLAESGFRVTLEDGSSGVQQESGRLVDVYGGVVRAESGVRITLEDGTSGIQQESGQGGGVALIESEFRVVLEDGVSGVALESATIGPPTIMPFAVLKPTGLATASLLVYFE